MILSFIKIKRLIDSRPQRERVLIVITALSFIYFVWMGLLYDPMQAKRRVMEEEITKITADTAGIDAQIQKIVAENRNSKLQTKQEKHERLQRQHGALDRRLQSLTTDLISPSRMAQVLQDLLSKDKEIQLIGLQSLPAEPLILQGQGQELLEREDRKLFKHGFIMVIKGEYFSILRHLRKLERLRWRLYWDSLEYKVDEYPEAMVSIGIYTLSTDEGWIGV